MRVLSLLASLLITTFAYADTPKPPPLAALVPPNAIAALLIERDATEIFRKAVETQPALRAELGGYLQRKLGFDPFQVSGIAAWAESYNPPRISVYLRGARLVGPSDLAPAVVSNAQGGILLQSPGASAPAGPPTQLGRLLAEVAGSELVFAIVDFSLDPSAAALVQQFKIEAARFAIGKNVIRAEVAGDPQKLEIIGKMVIGGIATAIEKLAQEREKALAKPEVTIDGAAAIWGYHQMLATQKELEPRIAGNRLVFEYKIPDFNKLGGSAAMPVAMIGVMAAVAIPAFTKYTKRSKSVEARMNVSQIARLLQAHYEGNKSPKYRFASSDWTPSAPCAQQPGGKCAGVSGGAWQQLGFSIDTPHYYQYRIVNRGVGKKAGFLVEARGDLDSNGVYSRFAIEGSVGDDGGVKLAPIVIENENE